MILYHHLIKKKQKKVNKKHQLHNFNIQIYYKKLKIYHLKNLIKKMIKKKIKKMIKKMI